LIQDVSRSVTAAKRLITEDDSSNSWEIAQKNNAENAKMSSERKRNFCGLKKNDKNQYKLFNLAELCSYMD